MNKERSEPFEKRPRTFAWRWIQFVSQRPAYAFCLYWLLIAILAFTPQDTQVRAFYLLTFPWLLLLLLIVNLPFVGFMLRQFKTTEGKKVNHALEHGTIFFLRKRYPGKFRIGGRAVEEGFRLNGLGSPDHIASAFEELCEHLARGDTSSVISEYCGSNIVTAQGYAIVLLTVSAPFLILLPLSLRSRIVILGSNLVVYFLLRKRLGNWLQRRFFMSFTSETPVIHSIREVKPEARERRRVFLVRIVLRHPQPPSS